MTTVGVAIPSIPPRGAMLGEALTSVALQTRPVDQISVVVDHERRGAPITLARAVDCLTTEWVVPLGDDDWLATTFVERCLTLADAADVVYPWPEVVGGVDPRPWVFGVPFRPEFCQAIPGGGAMIRRSLIDAIGGMPTPEITPQSQVSGEDFLLWELLLAAGARFVHLPERLWYWRHHGVGASGVPGNTSGLPTW